jgi:hypothetical protein
LSFALNPSPLLFRATVITVIANPRLLPIYPRAFVLSSILPNKATFAVTFILLKVTDVLLAIRPDQVTVSMHFVIEPVAVVPLVVGPNVDT